MSEWIEWKGGEQPVADGVMVEAVLRYETIAEHDVTPAEAWGWRWDHNGDGTDIIAYRVVDAPQDPKDTRIAELEAENAELRKDAEAFRTMVEKKMEVFQHANSAGVLLGARRILCHVQRPRKCDCCHSRCHRRSYGDARCLKSPFQSPTTSPSKSDGTSYWKFWRSLWAFPPT